MDFVRIKLIPAYVGTFWVHRHCIVHVSYQLYVFSVFDIQLFPFRLSFEIA